MVFPLYSGAFFPAIFRACPFSFLYISPWWWSCFLPCFFWWFLGAFSVLFSVLFFVFFCSVFFCAFYRAFFHAFFRSSRAFFSAFFFVPWAAPKTSNHNILHGICPEVSVQVIFLEGEKEEEDEEVTKKDQENEVNEAIVYQLGALSDNSLCEIFRKWVISEWYMPLH